MWCLGNEMDGPWQIGHKTADEYGRLAAETARRCAVDPLELVACGSSNGRDADLRRRGSATVLERDLRPGRLLSLHAYYEPHDGDLASFLASAPWTWTA